MSDTMNGAELARLILRRGTTPAQVAEMDLETLTRTVADRRKRSVGPGAIDSTLTDEQLARAIMEYAQGEPVDWPVPSRAIPTWWAWARVPLLGVLGGGIGGFVFAIVGALLVLPNTRYSAVASFEALLLLLSVCAHGGAVLGGVVALVVARPITRRGFRARVPLAAGLAASFILAVGYFLWFIADLGQFNHLIPRSAESLIERHQAGERDFFRWNLRGADLSGANLSGFFLAEARLEGAKLTKAILRGTQLLGADLRGADLGGADLSQADLRWADLSEVELSEADLSDVRLDGANLQLADLSGADLSAADLQGANLCGADLTGADLHLAYMGRTTLDDATQLDAKWRLVWSIRNEGGTGRDLSGADLSGANLFGADLSGANLRGAKLEWAVLGVANLEGADLSETDLSDAYLYRANLSEADLRGANLSWADLTEANLFGARVTNEQLSKARSLEGATLPDGAVQE